MHNRVTQIEYYLTTADANANTSADETATYTYDTGCGNTTNSKGRLCTLADKAGTTTYSYDLKGRITAKSQLVSSLTQSHSYRYNSAGQMDQWITASGQIIGYGYANNKVSGITLNGAALISNVLYDPFGPPVGWLWPSASTPALKTYRDYDLDGRLTRWELKNGVSYIQRDVVWDNANRVTQLKDLLATVGTNPNNPQVFGYDNLDRLTTTNLGTATTAAQILAYDAIGNRTSATINGIISTYNLPTTSHKLTSTTGGTNPRTFTYDAMGNLTNDGKYTYTYWNNGRINTVTWVTGTTTNTATYNINALGQRVRKVAPSNVGGTRRFMNDEAGRIAGEYDAAGKLVQETIWLGDLPIATLRPKSGSTTTPIAVDTFYVHSDHLGSPRIVTRPSDNKVVWSWDSTEAFGNNVPNENPSALGAFTYNLRMPGQYFDKETGNFYNYFRDYDPALGRYVQSDPIGLGGGFNTYGYVNLSPLSYTDPYGLLCISANNRMTCTVPGGPAFSLPSPIGQPRNLGPGDRFYHETNVSRDLDGANPECVMKELTNNPTPGLPRPASPGGTPNNARVPGFGDNFVSSFLTTAHGSGIPIVVNTAGVGDGSAFGPGYVARYVQGGRAYTRGEGTSGWQSIGGVSDFMNDQLWGGQLDGIIKKCKCR